MTSALLQAKNLSKSFPVREGIFLRAKAFNQAVDSVDFSVNAGETLGLVGESGCGKSTLARCIAKLQPPDSGQILFEGQNVTDLSRAQTLAYRRSVQMIFQDPMESLNARHSVEEILTEPFIIHGLGDYQFRQKEIRRLLDIVGLPESACRNYPFEFSGGQRQRIGIARALALNPRLIICDEAVSALDVSIQSQILNLLLDLQNEFGISYLFIAHDLAVVKHISDRVAVMYLGQIVETANSEEIYKNPLHPYTRSLIASIPVPDPHRKVDGAALHGEVPSAINLPRGCRFHTRCPSVMEQCRSIAPQQIDRGNHVTACHLLEN
ncbi:MAG: ABC transporter ATP-binding protein [Pseudomonadota bacterium]